MNRTLYLIATAMLLGVGASAQLVSDDYETDVVGEKPANASVVRPSTIGPDLFTKVVDSSVNTAGSGNGTQIYDDSVDGGALLAYNFVADTASQLSAVRVDFSFSCLDSSGPGDDYISLAVGKYGAGSTIGSYTTRYTDARLYNDGTLDIRSASGSSKTGIDISSGSHTLSIFINDFIEPFPYLSPNSVVTVLPEGGVDYWLDGELLQSTSMDLDDLTSGGTVGTTTNNLGQFGFVSTTADINLSYVVDDFVISSLEDNPPPMPEQPDYLLLDDFEEQTVGGRPSVANVVRPNTVSTDLYTRVVDSSVNTAGSGNGVQFYDNDVGNGLAQEYSISAGVDSQFSVAMAQFNFSCLDTNGPGDDYIAVAFGEYSASWKLSSNSRRWCLARLYNDGTIDFTSASGTNSFNNDISSGSHTLTIFVNDYDTQPVNYTGPDGSYNALSTNSVAYWLDGSKVITTLLDLDDPILNGGGGTVGTSEDNIGKFGFSAGSTDTNLNYVLDNILVTTNILVNTYNEWLRLFPAVGSSTNWVDDPDADGMENLLEYALGGNPTLDDADTIQPKYIEDGGGGWLNYVYNRRLGDTSLTYEVKADDDLVGSLDRTATEVGSGDLGNGFESVTNRISTATDPVGFMQLKVESSE